MTPNHSPWIKQLKRVRPIIPLTNNTETDVAIVGGGIAGVVTAYYILRDTTKNVVLLEGDKIAHGATGHNAGQVTSYFERPLSEIAEEFGVEMAVDGQRSIEYAWTLLDKIILEAKLKTPMYKFTGYAGLSSFEQVLRHLKNNRYRVDHGLLPESIVIANSWDRLEDIPKKFEDLYTIAEHNDLLSLLETDNHDYVASLSYPKGCMNSALFVEELLTYLVTTYPSRFSFFEGSMVKKIILKENTATLLVLEHNVQVKNVVLCTNGFENFSIINEHGDDLDAKFHDMIMGYIGYMSGYIQALDEPPAAVSYFPKVNTESIDPTGENYFYLTRRPHEHEGKTSYNLVCVGGPDRVLPRGAIYDKNEPYFEGARDAIDDFLKDTYKKYPSERVQYDFCWHGLMGYTQNGIRLIGPEPVNPILMYNLGCNGIGILPSIFGGKRIAKFVNGEKVEPSIFDGTNKSAKI